MDLPHYRWAAITTRTFEDLAADGSRGRPVLDVAQAQGYVRPRPQDAVREDDTALLALVKAASFPLDHDALIRTVRVDSLRRITDAETAVFDTHVVGGFQRQGMTFAQAVDAANHWGGGTTELQEQGLVTLYRRQQERRWTDYTVVGIERVLEDLGLYKRPERAPAFSSWICRGTPRSPRNTATRRARGWLRRSCAWSTRRPFRVAARRSSGSATA